MKAEILEWKKEILNVTKIDEETKKEVTVQQEYGILTLRTEMPDSLPVNKILELKVIEEPDKGPGKGKETPEEPVSEEK